MVRLTERHTNKKDGYYMKCSAECFAFDDCNDCAKLYEIIDRLAAYEDTGLEPGQIKEAVDLLEDTISMSKVEPPKALMDWIERCTWHVRKCDELREELEQYEEAKREGRLIILPVVPGDELTRDGKVYRADHWNVLLTSFSEGEEKSIALFDVEAAAKAAAALKGQKGADDARNYIPWEAD